MKLASLTNVSKSTILRDLDILKQNGTLKRRGTEKTGYWEIESS
jgi:DeoR/GlpR family transcriptional regulator of sugar metabolism